MKAKIVLFAVLAALCSSLAFGMAKKTANVETSGVVEFYGNGPFARLCLKTNDQKLYYLVGDDKTIQELGGLHGNLVSVKGSVLDQLPPPEVSKAISLKVKSWKKL